MRGLRRRIRPHDGWVATRYVTGADADTRPAGARARPAAFTLATSFAASLAAISVLHLTHSPPALGLVTIAAVVAACSRGAVLRAAAGAALLGWLFLTGFVSNPMGELYLDPARDGWRLGLLLTVALISSLV